MRQKIKKLIFGNMITTKLPGNMLLKKRIPVLVGFSAILGSNVYILSDMVHYHPKVLLVRFHNPYQVSQSSNSLGPTHNPTPYFHQE
uniref:Uncharacterized protein n=1 Tax=Rhizophora mucronata TaxID=61149 RepID=A0A2P2QWR8_RHIMU